jgi:hypothetical protein
MTQAPLHPTIVAMVSLAANIASNHPKKGLCQVERLRGLGISDEHIDVVADIARHLRDEAAQLLDSEFDATFAAGKTVAPVDVVSASASASCCTPTAKGNACC